MPLLLSGALRGEGLTYDDGNLTDVYLPGDVDRDGDVDESDQGALLGAWGKCEGEQGYNPNADFNGDGCVNESDMAILLIRWGTTNKSLQIHYTWDAENRLVYVGPVFEPVNGDKKVEFTYDYLGRRAEKAVYAWNEEDPNDPNDGYWEPTLRRRFVWYNWLMLLELEGGTGVPPVSRKYTWGLDLAGQHGGAGILPAGLESAGGIGGLLALHDPDDDGDPNDPNDVERSYVYFYDVNGNVGQLVAWASDYGGASGYDWHADRLVARYEYAPYGNVVGPDTDEDGEWQDDAGPYATENPIRLSTKYFDDETALGYWGYRYYSPGLGRWLTRDTIGEVDGPNLYCYVANAPIDLVDSVGKSAFSDCLCGPDVTHWLVGQINANVRSPEIAQIRHFMAIASTEWPDYPGLRGVFLMGAMWQFASLVSGGAVWDFKVSLGFEGSVCPHPVCSHTVTLCGQCFYYDVPGNIHYGAVGRAAGFNVKTLVGAPALVQGGPAWRNLLLGSDDEPGDTAAINIGIALYERNLAIGALIQAFGGIPFPVWELPIAESDLCEQVRKKAESLNGPNHARMVGLCPGIPCTVESWFGS